MTLSRKLRIVAGLCALGLVPAASPAEEPDGGPAAVERAASPVAEAVREALSGAYGEDSAVLAHYAGNGYRPIWTDAAGPTAAAGALIEALVAAPEHALPAARYDADELSLLAMGLDGGGAAPAERAGFERAMTRALLSYGRDIHSGVLEPREVDREIKVDPPRPEPGELLAGIAGAADPAAWLAGLAPDGDGYADLRRAYARMQEVVAAGGWGEPVPAGPTLELGDSGPRVQAVRTRLKALGDLPSETAGGAEVVLAANEVANDAGQPGAPGDPGAYDRELAEAVRRFQARHGLNTDGVVGPATRGALNVGAAERLGQIAASLERLRWLNRDPGDSYVKVNIAGYSMKVVENGREVFSSRVVVGQKTHPTPEFSDEMEHMVVNPSWNVPSSIATNEILPKLRQDPTWLDRNNMRLVDGFDPWFIDWSRVTPATFPGRIKQAPGPGNALGRVKFMFPNDNAIYLHDTPARSLFARDMRAHSHGCIRVEKPIELAHLLLRRQESDPAAAFQGWRRSGEERWVQLEEHLPVHIGYRTAWIDGDGTPQFRNDIYGRDARILAALEAEGLTLGEGEG